MKNTRKKRCDRTHIVYQLEVNGLLYIGITAKTCSTVNKSVQTRFKKHVQRGRTENKSWPLYEAMRKYGAENFTVTVLETMRGKALAHSREREIIREIKPQLNLA